MSGLFRFFKWVIRTGLPFAALALHFVIVIAYARRWDRAAAVTVFPLWAWGTLGFLTAFVSWIFFRTKFAAVLLGVWMLTTLIGSDETKPLLRFNAEKPLIGLPPDVGGKRLLRVVTLNCRYRNSISAEEVIPWKPDIVLLQEAPPPQALRVLSSKLFPDGRPGDHFRGGYECAVLTRGVIKADITTMGLRVLPCTLDLDGRTFHVVCVHLQGAVKNISLHRTSTWGLHYRNRLSRRAELMDVRKWLDSLSALKTATSMGSAFSSQAAPVIIGGDFNAPAGDAVFRELEPEFTDAFDAVGSGWGNTFPNQSPVLRIDYIFSNPLLTPVHARTVESANSDHRMVVADYLVVDP